MYCPNCHNRVAEEVHEFTNCIEYRCPYCGHKIKVIHKPFMKVERQYDTGTV